MKQNNTKEIITITLKLLVICSIVAAIVAFVNAITKDTIALNEKLDTAKALSGIYECSLEYDKENGTYISAKEAKDGEISKIAEITMKDGFEEEYITAFYAVNDNKDNTLGYCVSLEPQGFKDKIKMLVAVNPDSTVKGVKIVSMSETSGIGTKAADPSFLDKFVNKGEAEIDGVDTISGATKTSKPVKDAVHAASKLVKTYTAANGGAK